MKSVTVTGIVMKSMDYRENDKLINIITPDKGIITAAVFGARSNKSLFVPIAQPFVCAEFILSQRNGLFRVSSAVPIEYYHALAQDYERYEAACTILKCINDSLMKDDPNADVFMLFSYLLKALTYSQAPCDYLLTVFYLRLLFALGLCPTYDRCSSCSRLSNGLADMRDIVAFSVETGGLLCRACAAKHAHTSAHSSSILRIPNVVSCANSEIENIELGAEAIHELLPLARSFLKYHIELQSISS